MDCQYPTQHLIMCLFGKLIRKIGIVDFNRLSNYWCISLLLMHELKHGWIITLVIILDFVIPKIQIFLFYSLVLLP
jgi:hypothetical protein